MSHVKILLSSLFTLSLTSSLLAACGDDGASLSPDAGPDPMPMPDAPVQPVDKCTTQPTALDPQLAWYGTNRADLIRWLDAAGCKSEGYDPAKKPVATFDWDNTVSKNDFGDAITFHFIKNGLVKQPTSWAATSPYLTAAALTALDTACGVPTGTGNVPTTTNTVCADEMLSIYVNSVTKAGQPAFGGHNARWIEPSYAWTAQLLAGYTHAQIQQYMLDAVTPQLAAAEGTTQTIGTTTGLNAWLRIYPQTKDLIAAVKSRGYDVWIITASPQDAIAAVSSMAGVAPDHVIGIRSKTDSAGRLTHKFEGCGPVADDQQQLISYIQGKRCWINKVIYGDTTANAMRKRPDGQRQVFAAGDSDTDIEFLKDATYKLVINRGKKELMCIAYDNEGDSWRINPMFIGPRAAATSPYACPTAACKDENLSNTPCRDQGGNVIPPQNDTVHP
ncbi:MAG: haloacid dehalogenase-like hydrolase [Myxococcales bacterium]|nr:haloacid dehalogenase-like hydrolase [Myxococcales bacterium]